MTKAQFKNKLFRTILTVAVVIAMPLSAYFLNKKFSDRRGPASDNSISDVIEKSSFDLSEVDPQDFKKAFKYQILKDISVRYTEDGQQIFLGLFLIKNENGSPVFVCDQYPTLDLIFAADGMAFSGDIPHMIVRTDCLVAADQKHIEGYPIPLDRIVRSPLSHEFVITSPSTREEGRIFFRGVVEAWPHDWNLVGIKLYGKNPEQVLEVNGYEVISVLGKPLTISAD